MNRATELLDDAAHDEESEAEPVAPAIHALEGLEDAPVKLGSDPNPGAATRRAQG